MKRVASLLFGIAIAISVAVGIENTFVNQNAPQYSVFTSTDFQLEPVLVYIEGLAWTTDEPIIDICLEAIYHDAVMPVEERPPIIAVKNVLNYTSALSGNLIDPKSRFRRNQYSNRC